MWSCKLIEIILRGCGVYASGNSQPEGVYAQVCKCSQPACLTSSFILCALLQARLSFTHIGGPESSRRAGMDAGDADGADALLSLAKLANAESSGILMDEDVDLQQDTYMDQIDTPSLAARPRRSAKPPPKADVRHCPSS